jgi:hypothetical protein
MTIVERIKLTARLSGARLVVVFNPLHWKLVPKVNTHNTYADDLWLVGDFYKMYEVIFLCFNLSIWIDTGSDDDIMYRDI